MFEIKVFEIIEYFYPEDTPLRRLLIAHGEQVRDKSLEILSAKKLNIDRTFISNAALLHDIGIIKCHAPKILCEGCEPYISHGVIGADMLRMYGEKFKVELELYARICERHTGVGLTKNDILLQKLPIPVKDYLPESVEEKLICFADKFFSKSGSRKEKDIQKIRKSIEKFGEDNLKRFDELYYMFKL